MEDFANQFKPFYMKLTILNYKLLSNSPLPEEYQKIKKCLHFLIPIFDRILNQEDLNLESLKDESEQTVNNDKKKELDDEPDEEGDKLVEELTNKSLEELEIIKNEMWCSIEELNDDIESDQESNEMYYSDDSNENVADIVDENEKKFNLMQMYV
jgi:hypothetical protein